MKASRFVTLTIAWLALIGATVGSGEETKVQHDARMAW